MELNNFRPYSAFSYWFIWNPTTCTYEIHDIQDNFNYIGHVKVAETAHGYVFDGVSFIDCKYEINTTEVSSDFAQFEHDRPEYLVGTQVDVVMPGPEIDHVGLNAATYARYITGVALVAAMMRNPGKDPDDAIPYKCLDWLNKCDFYTAPASSNHHESFVGGLCIHTLNVLNNALMIRKVSKFSTVSEYSIALVALVHDWCKVGRYEMYLRNVKNDQTGAWEKVPSYKIKDKSTTCFGHGASSMYMAQHFFRLSMDEALAIRWHMGEYNVANNEMNELHQANTMYPIVYLIQFADRLACTEY